MIQNNGTVTKFEQAFHKDHRYCDCPIPMNLKKWNDALGRMTVLRVCCMAKALEDMTGIDLLQVFEFEPKWVWDCDEMVERENVLTGEQYKAPRGLPPEWLEKRMKAKGIPMIGAENHTRKPRLSEAFNEEPAHGCVPDQV